MSLLFFTLRMPQPQAGQAIELKDLIKRDYGLTNWSYDVARLHITLFNLGQEASPERVTLARHGASSIRAAPFEVEFNRIVSWPDALVLRGDDKPASLIEFRRQLGAGLKRIWPDRLQPSGFTPHVTLMRGATPVEDLQVRSFRWVVRDFALVYSVAGRYIELGRWPLLGSRSLP